jgi:hypothetical protein
MLRNGTYKFLKNETATAVAQSLMSIARSKKVPYFSKKLAPIIYAYEDARYPEIIHITGLDHCLDQ